MSRQSLVLFDIDKTLLDKDYKPNAPIFAQIVLDLQEAGWCVGLNSDTPAVRIARLAREWNCDGPIVAEFGSAVFSLENALKRGSADWARLRENKFNDITGLFLNQLRILYSDFYVLIGDTTAGLELVQKVKFDRPTILVNAHRRYSLSFFLRMPKGQKPKTQALLMKLADLASDCFLRAYVHNPFQPLVDVNPDYNVVIVHYGEAAKRHAMPYLLNHYGPIVMVGDNMNDYLAKPDEPSPAIQLAVGNATSEYKAVCQFVANSELTRGANACAGWIIENTTRLRGE